MFCKNFQKNWIKEFEYLKKTKLDYIEFFTEKEKNYKNPFWSYEGLKRIKKETSLLKYKRIILCDNFAIKNSFTSQKTQEYLKDLINRLSFFKNAMLIIPIFSKKIQDKQNFTSHIKHSSMLLKHAMKKNVKISFEIFNKDKMIRKFCLKLSKIKNFGITYDTGNAYLFNKNFYNELNLLKKFVNHIHLKDRDKLGRNVELGKGEINFKNFLKN